VDTATALIDSAGEATACPPPSIPPPGRQTAAMALEGLRIDDKGWSTQRHAARPSVLVVADYPLWRRGLSQLIALVPNLSIAGEAASLREAIAVAHASQPALALVDLDRRDQQGLEILSAIKNALPTTRIVALSLPGSATELGAAMRAGACGYLRKDIEPRELTQHLLCALAGRTVVTDSFVEAFVATMQGVSEEDDRDLKQLTGRELDVLRCVAAGMSNRMISEHLAISEGTVKVHVKHMLKKLAFRSRLEAAVWMTKRGPSASGAE